MTSEVSGTLRGLKAVAHIGDGTESSRQDDLVKTVSAILAPDARTALQKRSGSEAAIKLEPSKKELQHFTLERARSGGSKRMKEPSLASIHVEEKHYADDIKTTKDMANQVSNILGGKALNNLRLSCHQRKEEDAKNQQQQATKISSKLTPEMRAAMERNNRTSLAPQSKKLVLSGDENSESEGEEEKPEYGSRPGRIRRHRSREYSSKSPSTTHECSPVKMHSSRSNTSQGRSRSPMQKAASGSHHGKNRTQDHQNDFANLAEDVGIDLEDGMDEIFNEDDMEHDSRNTERKSRESVQGRRRRPQKGQSCGGAAPGRRGRHGVRGVDNIKHAQVAMMTSVDQTKKFREEDYVFEQHEEEVKNPGEEEVEVPPEEGLFDFDDLAEKATQAVNLAGEYAASAAAELFGKREGLVGALNAATGRVVGGSAASSVVSEDDYSDDYDEPKVKANGSNDGGGSWRFSGGGLPS